MNRVKLLSDEEQAAIMVAQNKLDGLIVDMAVIHNENIDFFIPEQVVSIPITKDVNRQMLDNLRVIENKQEFSRSQSSFVAVMINNARNFKNYLLCRDGFEYVTHIDFGSPVYPNIRHLALLQVNRYISRNYEIHETHNCLTLRNGQIFYSIEQMQKYVANNFDDAVIPLLFRAVRELNCKRVI